MKNIMKAVLFCASVFGLTGCSTLNLALEPMVNLEKRCYTLPNGEQGISKAGLECMVRETKKKDEARRKLGMVTTSGYYEQQLAQVNSFENTFTTKAKFAKEIKEKEDAAFKVMEQNKIRDRCLLISDAQLQEKLEQAYLKGDYLLVEKLQSDKYKEQIISYCIKEARK